MLYHDHLIVPYPTNFQACLLLYKSCRLIYPVPTMKLLGIMLRNRCWPITFHTNYYNRRCQQMMSKLASVINPSCPDHTKLSVWFQLYSDINIGPPLSTLLQPKMPTNGVKTDRCDQPLSPKEREDVRVYTTGEANPVLPRDGAHWSLWWRGGAPGMTSLVCTPISRSWWDRGWCGAWSILSASGVWTRSCKQPWRHSVGAKSYSLSQVL